MDFYWLYNLSNVSLFFLIVFVITAGGLAKTLFFPDFFENKWKISKDSNDFVIGFLALTGAFLSITMGLIAVGTFDNYNNADSIVSTEASALSALYSDAQMFEKPEKAQMTDQLKIYTKYVIEEAWPEQQRGIVPVKGNEITQKFQEMLRNYQPESNRDQIAYAELLGQYNGFLEKRRDRLIAVKQGLPASVYVVLLLGLLVNMLISWQIKVDNRPIEIFVSALTGILAGSLVYIIVAMDNPFRGEFSVSADAFRMVLDTMMK